ncbi:hypothetical protein TKK_0010163 [Trichogramma kaykai]|uniref:Uncharacterized protein n=1 Tax=Trichogramma kaykai TaxID=54128 RepID=A0ABD2WZ38_9HYME
MCLNEHQKKTLAKAALEAISFGDCKKNSCEQLQLDSFSSMPNQKYNSSTSVSRNSSTPTTANNLLGDNAYLTVSKTERMPLLNISNNMSTHPPMNLKSKVKSEWTCIHVIDQKIHPQTIIAGYRIATQVERKALNKIMAENSSDPECFHYNLMNIAVLR